MSLEDSRKNAQGVFQLALRGVNNKEGIKVIEDIFVAIGERPRTKLITEQRRGDRIETGSFSGALNVKWWIGTEGKESGGKVHVLVSGIGMIHYRTMEEITW